MCAAFIPMVQPDRLKEAVTRLDAAGFQVHFHPIGDGAVRQVTRALCESRRQLHDRGARDENR